MYEKIHIGSSGWSYKDWLGVFYPESTKQKDYLPYYSQIFDTVEVDSTFYGIPRASTVENWHNVTPDHFKFSLKAPQIITHGKRLSNCDAEWLQFIRTAEMLKQKLGPVILQFDYKFIPGEHFEKLSGFLDKHASDQLKLCVEIRNKNWHQQKFYDLLKKYNVALVLSDLYYMPRVVELTADFTYIRLIGNRKHIPDDFSHSRINRDKDLDWWTDWIEKFLEKELEVWVYSNNHYQGHTPDTLRSIFNRLES